MTTANHKTEDANTTTHSSYKTLPKSNQSVISDLLIAGYIREIEETLNNQIIPHSINTICWKYYFVSKLLFCLRCQPNEIHIADIHAEQQEDRIISTNKINDNIGSIFLSGKCVTTKFTACPPLISDKIKAHSTNVIFKCGGAWSATSHALIIDTNTYNVYDWELPQIPGKPYANCLSYSASTQMLISCGGQFRHAHSTYGLCFDGNTKNDDQKWDWKPLASMTQKRYNAKSVSLDRYNQLMVIGGKEEYSNLTSAEIYDIGKNEWKEIASFDVARRAAGICYNQYKDEIFLGGGIDNDEIGRSIECYNLYKNKWNLVKVPNTTFPHKLHPALWTENSNFLWIASICGNNGIRKSSNSIEWIDLRICDKWATVIQDNLLTQVFGISNISDHDDCYLLVN